MHFGDLLSVRVGAAGPALLSACVGAVFFCIAVVTLHYVNDVTDVLERHNNGVIK